MLGYFNFKRFGKEVLLTNDFGRYVFLSHEEFQQFACNELPPTSSIYNMLKEHFFLFDGHQEEFLSKTKVPMRNSRNYLFSATVLHIFVVTNLCNGRCVYCQAQNAKGQKYGKMTKEIAKCAVDIALSSPANHLTFEFQGGEPLMNFDVIQYIVEYTEANQGKKSVSFNIVSNLTILTNEMLSFLISHHVSISTSLDGPEELHERNRPLISEQGSYQKAIKQVRKIRENGGGVGAIQTTTRASLTMPTEIIDAYVENGFKSIFLRPLTPLGFAFNHWEEIGYTPEKFVLFYRSALQRILEYNRSGIHFIESHAAIFLRKILGGFGENYMELRSPCGAGLGQLAYYYDGNIYTCDEGRMLAEMGDDSFLLGSVFHSDYNSLADHSHCKTTCTASVTESIPECCDCVYQPYCGTCPVINLAVEHDIFPRSPLNYRCVVYRGMLDVVFEVLQSNNDSDLAIFKSWL